MSTSFNASTYVIFFNVCHKLHDLQLSLENIKQLHTRTNIYINEISDDFTHCDLFLEL